MPFYVEFLENIAFWHLDDEKNLFNVETVTAMHKCLDEIEANPEVTCMISIGYGKNYSQGLDLEKFQRGHTAKKTMKFIFGFVVRVLTFPMPTIAAINGHCYGAGAFLAVCHDYRIMREGRGYMCFPEAKLGVSFGLEVLYELLRCRVPRTAQSMAILSLPFTAEEALKHGLVQETSSLDTLCMRAQEAARRLLAKNTLDRENLGKIKCAIFDSVIKAEAESNLSENLNFDQLSKL